MDIAKFSKTFTLNISDGIKAAIMTGLGTALAAIIETVSDRSLPTLEELKSAAVIGVIAGSTYLVKNFLQGTPVAVEIDPKKTAVINTNTKTVIAGNTDALMESK